MAQITQSVCLSIIDAAKRGERYPLTVWEQEQLAHIALKALQERALRMHQTYRESA